MHFEYLHYINIKEHHSAHIMVKRLNSTLVYGQRCTDMKARSNVSYDFLLETLNEVISEEISDFPLLPAKIEHLLPVQILHYTDRF